MDEDMLNKTVLPVEEHALAHTRVIIKISRL